MANLTTPDDFEEHSDGKKPLPELPHRECDISMYEALAFYEGNLNGFQVEDIKQLAGRFWDQELWDSLAADSFSLDYEDQSPKLPFYREDLKAWFYFP